MVATAVKLGGGPKERRFATKKYIGETEGSYSRKTERRTQGKMFHNKEKYW